MLVTEQATVTCLPPWLRTTPCWERRGAVCCEVLRSRRPRDREGPLSVRRAWPPHGAARGGLEPRHTPRTHTSTHRQRSRSLRWWRPAASTSPRGFRCDTSSSPSRPRCCPGCRQTCRPSTPSTPSTTRTRQNQMCWAALVRAFGVDATAQPLQSRPRIGSHSRARGAEGGGQSGWQGGRRSAAGAGTTHSSSPHTHSLHLARSAGSFRLQCFRLSPSSIGGPGQGGVSRSPIAHAVDVSRRETAAASGHL